MKIRRFAMRTLSDHEINALHQMKLHLGSNAELARVMGISAAHIGRLLKGGEKFVEHPTWEKIEPHLQPYIKAFQAKPESTPCHLTDSAQCPFRDDGDEKRLFTLLRDFTPSERLRVLSYAMEMQESKSGKHIPASA